MVWVSSFDKSCFVWLRLLVQGQFETDIDEQSQGIADVADGELFHGLSLLVG